MKKNITDLEKSLKKIFLSIICLSIPLGKKHFFHHHNSKRYFKWPHLNESPCI